MINTKISRTCAILLKLIKFIANLPICYNKKSIMNFSKMRYVNCRFFIKFGLGKKNSNSFHQNFFVGNIPKLFHESHQLSMKKIVNLFLTQLLQFL